MTKSDLNTERWLPVVGFEGLYEVSDRGRVRSMERVVHRSNGRTHTVNERILKPDTDRGYHKVYLMKDGERLTRRIHTLVLEAFIGPKPEGMVCCHNNDIPDDNRVENLRWDTQLGNIRDIVRRGATFGQKKVACPRGHALSEVNNRSDHAAIGRRTCLACQRTYNYIYRNPEFKPWFDGISNRVYNETVGGTYAYGYARTAAAETVVASIITEAIDQIIDPAA